MDLYKLLVVFFLLAGFQSGLAGEIHVRPGGSNPAVAIKSAKPGDVVLIHPGIYGGGQWIKGIRGTPEQVITIRAAEPKSPPVISGGPAGWQFSACSHLVIEDIVFEHQTDNGLNIDDDGLYKKGNLYAATNIHLKRIVVRDLNAEGNNDGIKLSGLRDFTVNDCRISNWGKVGCGLDMVGCTDGKIVGVIADGCHKGGWGIQAKGGSDGILIQDCQVRNVTQRGIQVGGVTGPDSFREKGSVWEAKKIQIESCDVYGGDASIAIIHAMDVSIKSCRWIHPKKWFFRFLNENNSFGFQASRNVLIQENLFVATEANFIGPVNSGILWNPSIRFEDNIWYHETIPNWDLRLGLPSGELRGVACVNPPSSFLRKDFVVTKSRFEQLLSLLSDEIPQREFIVRLKWFSTIFSLVFLWVGLWIFSLGAKVDSMSVARQRVKGNSIGRWFLFLLALVFLLLHMDLPPGFSDFDEVIKEAKSDRFELLVRASFLGGGVVLMLTCFDRVLLGISDSLWLSFFWGIFSGVSIYGLEYLNECRLGRFDVDRNHISIDASVGLFSGVLAHGFARDIRAWFLRLSRRSGGCSTQDGLLWTLIGLALVVVSVYYPSGFNAEFLYDRFQSYGANLRVFSSPVDVSSLAESILFCVPFVWGIARIYGSQTGGTYKQIWLFVLFVVVFQSTNFFRIGRCFSLDQTLIAILVSFATWLVARLACNRKIGRSWTTGSKRIFRNFGGLLAVASWVLMFFVGEYL